jgi:hypothetical protein
MDSKKNVLTIKNKVDKLQSLVNNMNRTKYFWTVQMKMDKFPTLTTSMKQSGGDHLC